MSTVEEIDEAQKAAKKMTVANLKKELTAHGESTDGNKAVLLARLLEALERKKTESSGEGSSNAEANGEELVDVGGEEQASAANGSETNQQTATLMSTDARQARLQRFGIDAPPSMLAADDLKRKRMEKFGTVPEEDAVKKRREKFGTTTVEDTIRKRQEKFGTLPEVTIA